MSFVWLWSITISLRYEIILLLIQLLEKSVFLGQRAAQASETDTADSLNCEHGQPLKYDKKNKAQPQVGCRVEYEMFNVDYINCNSSTRYDKDI